MHFLDRSAHQEGQEERLHDWQAVHLDYEWHRVDVKLLVGAEGWRQYRSDEVGQVGSDHGVVSHVPDDLGAHYVPFHVVLIALVVVVIPAPSVVRRSLGPFPLDRDRSPVVCYSL
jgi:hypothetical protein